MATGQDGGGSPVGDTPGRKPSSSAATHLVEAPAGSFGQTAPGLPTVGSQFPLAPPPPSFQGVPPVFQAVPPAPAWQPSAGNPGFVPAAATPPVAAFAAPPAAAPMFTSQNAAATFGRYRLAGLGQRFAAVLLDLLICAAIPMLIIFSASAGAQYEETPDTGLILLGYGGLFLLPFINQVFIQGISGSTLGKKVVGLRVVRESGDGIGFGPAFGRWLLGLLLSWVTCGIFGLVDLVVMLSNERRQRLVDQWLRLNVVSSSSSGPRG